jgi:hypothetical protein
VSSRDTSLLPISNYTPETFEGFLRHDRRRSDRARRRLPLAGRSPLVALVALATLPGWCLDRGYRRWRGARRACRRARLSGGRRVRISLLFIVRIASSVSDAPADQVVLDAYIIFQTLLGSVIMYGGSGLPYIDALFFASGAATQSGLNT